MWNLKKDRRLLSNVPDRHVIRTNRDRRGSSKIPMGYGNINDFMEGKYAGLRYQIAYQISVSCILGDKEKVDFNCEGVDISTVGLLVKINDEQKKILEDATSIKVAFKIAPGTLPEDYGSTKVVLKAKIARMDESVPGFYFCGLGFLQNLDQYTKNRQNIYMTMTGIFIAFCIFIFTMLMHAEIMNGSWNNRLAYIFVILMACLMLFRYLCAFCYRPKKVNPDYTPAVSLIIKCHNSENTIEDTIVSCINQDYPVEKLELIVVDYNSLDDTKAKVEQVFARLFQEPEQFETKERLHFVICTDIENCDAVKRASNELVVILESGSSMDPYCIRTLVQPFEDKKVAAVSGRILIPNAYENQITKIVSVMHFWQERIVNASESVFDAVTSIPETMVCYRKDVLIGGKAGIRALSKNRICYQDSALFMENAVTTMKEYRQLHLDKRCKWMKDSCYLFFIMWKKEPFMALLFYFDRILQLTAPLVIIYACLCVPVLFGEFPLLLLICVILLTLLSSGMRYLFRKTSDWLSGTLLFFGSEILFLYQIYGFLWKRPFRRQEVVENEKQKK